MLAIWVQIRIEAAFGMWLLEVGVLVIVLDIVFGIALEVEFEIALEIASVAAFFVVIAPYLVADSLNFIVKKIVYSVLIKPQKLNCYLVLKLIIVDKNFQIVNNKVFVDLYCHYHNLEIENHLLMQIEKHRTN